MDRKRLRDVDRGWAWVVMGAVCATQFLLGTLNYGYGIIQIVLLDTFHQGLVETSWVISVAAGLMCIPGPMAGILTNVTSCRTTMLLGSILIFMGLASSAFVTRLHHLYVTMSFLTGLGTGILYPPSLVVLGFYFDRHLDIAMGIAITGGGIGMMAGAPFISYLAETYGWRGMFLLQAAIMANLCVCSLLCFPSTIECKYSSDGHKMISSGTGATESTGIHGERATRFTLILHSVNACAKAIFTLPMLTFCCSGVLCNIAILTVNLYLPAFTVKHGATTSQSSLLFTVMGICNTLSRLLAGISIGSGTINKYLMYMSGYGLIGLLTFVFPFIPNSFATSLVYAGLYGMYTAGPIIVVTTITKDLVGLRYLAIAFGVENLVFGTGLVLGPPLAGWTVEASGTYIWSFVFAGSTFLLSSFLLMLILLCHKPHEGEFGLKCDSASQDESDMGTENRLEIGRQLRVSSLATSLTSLPGITPVLGGHTASTYLHTSPQ